MRVNVHTAKALTDPRFVRAAQKLNQNRFEVLGRVIACWAYAYAQRTDRLSADDIDGIAEVVGFADALVAAGLAEKRGRKVRLRGTKEQLDFLAEQDRKRELAAEAKRKNAAARKEPRGPSPGKIPRDVPIEHEHALDPDPDADAGREPELGLGLEQAQHAAAEQQQQDNPPAGRDGFRPPTGGKAERRAAERVKAGELAAADVRRTWLEVAAKVDPHKLVTPKSADRIALTFIERAHAKPTNGAAESDYSLTLDDL